MKAIVFGPASLIAFALLIACAFVAAGMAPPDRPGRPPALGLRQAIDAAEAHAKDRDVDLAGCYLCSVRLVARPDAPGQRAWEVVWDREGRADDDEIEFLVGMDGAVERRFRG